MKITLLHALNFAAEALKVISYYLEIIPLQTRCKSAVPLQICILQTTRKRK
jgi:hypothetical protein